MRTLGAICILVLVTTLTCAQTGKEPNCKVQDLAIEAALGDPVAQYDLGVAFHRGVDVPQDFTKAANYVASSKQRRNCYVLQ